MKNNIILYFPYKLNRSISGSSVRPNKIIAEFMKFSKERNKNLIVISGDSKERRQQIVTFKKTIKFSSVEYCYFENATMPIWLTDQDKIPRNYLWENNFLKQLYKQGIPIGIFYRDVYWKFKDYYPFRGIKLSIMKMIYKKELKFYDNIANKIFLPSLSMNEYCQFKAETFALPPAIDDVYPSDNKFENKTLFYVGSLNENSGLNDIIQIAETIRKNNLNFKIKIVCPKDDLLKSKEKFKLLLSDSNVEILHLHGEELKKEYKNVSIALIPRKVNSYNSFAMPIKLFEYIENGLPIISSNITETAKFIESNEVGCVYKSNADFTKILVKLSNADYYKKLLNNINDIKIENSWRSRVLEIDNLLRRKEAK